MSVSALLRAALAIAAISLTACGGDDSSSRSSGNATQPTATSTAAAEPTADAAGLSVSADAAGGLAFDQSALTADAGTVTLSMENPSSSGVPHLIAIKGDGVDEQGETVQPGGTSTVTATLEPGTYTFYCPLPGHEESGMTGTLEVS